MWNLKKQTNRNREHVGGCQCWWGGGWRMGQKFAQRVQTSNHEISSRDKIYSMMTRVNNIVALAGVAQWLSASL